MIPAFQAENYLGEVLKQTKAVFPLPGHILVVDDGSHDGTSRVAEKAGVQLLRHNTNLGKGAALRTGFSEAISRRYDFVIVLDADGQHDPAYIPRFLEAFSTGKYDVLIGTRRLQPSTMPFDRYLSNSYSSLVASVAAGKRIRDSQSGYRLLRVSLLKKMRLRSRKYETETEILIQAVRFLRARVGEIPIAVSYAGEESHIRRLGDTMRFIKIVLQTVGMS